MHCKTRLDLFFWHEDPRWVLRDTRGSVVFRVFRVCFPCVRGAVRVFRPGFRGSGLVFDTPIDISVRNGFSGVRGVRVCVGSGFGVGFSLAARRGTVPLPEGGWFRVGAVVV